MLSSKIDPNIRVLLEITETYAVFLYKDRENYPAHIAQGMDTNISLRQGIVEATLMYLATQPELAEEFMDRLRKAITLINPIP